MALWPRRSGGRSLLNIPRTLNISPLGNRSPVADTDQRKLHKRGRRGRGGKPGACAFDFMCTEEKVAPSGGTHDSPSQLIFQRDGVI